MFNNVLHNKCEATPFILASVFLDPETVHLQMEDTKQDIKYDNSDYLVSTPTIDKNILDNADDKTN